MSNKLLECNKSQLWQGCILGGIVNAVMTAEKQSYSPFRWWDGPRYILSNHLSTQEAVIAFERGWHSAAGSLVGLFYDSGSNIGPYRNSSYDLQSLLHEMPDAIKPIARESIDIHLMKHKTADAPEVAFVTGVIWGTQSDLESSSSWHDLIQNGMSIIEKELLGSSDDALVAWENSYNMSSDQITLAVRLFKMRLAQPETDIVLGDEIIQQLDRLSSGREGLDRCEGLLDALGFLFGPPASS